MSTVVMHPDVTRFFAGDRLGLQILQEIARTIHGLGESEMRVSRSQISFRHGRTFALVWRASMYVSSDVPVVLSIATPTRLKSTRFKQVVHPAPTTWMHHLELRDPSDIDEEVRAWLADAWSAACKPGDCWRA